MKSGAKKRGGVAVAAPDPAPAVTMADAHMDDVKMLTRFATFQPEVVFDGEILVERVLFDQTDRLADERDDASIESLAYSLKMHGQLAPIAVVRDGEAEIYRLVCGRRRLLAAKRCGWAQIWARELRFNSQVDMLAYRETENLQRLDLTPIEEAVAVAQMLDIDACGLAKVDAHIGRKFESFDVETRKRAVAMVAARIGKPERWVRDRSFIVRLDDAIRAKVMSGEIPLGHAREIAKLADPRVRSEAAKACFYHDGRLKELGDVREFVAKHLYSLAQVSWRLDASFDGKVACVECPHNSANQPGLFEHSAKHVSDPAEGKKHCPHLNGKEPKAGVCTLPACYQAKAAAASRAIASTASAAIRAAKDAKPKDRPKAKAQAIAGALPSYVAKSVVEARIQEREQAAKSRPKGIAVGKPKPVVHSWEKPEHKARLKLQEIMRQRCGKVEKLLDAHFQKARPGQWAMLQLAMKSKPMEAAVQYDDKKAAKAIESREFKAMLEAMAKPPTMENLLAVEKYCGTRFAVTKELDGTSADSCGVIEHIAAAFGIKLDEPAPTYEAILAKMKGEKPPENRADEPVAAQQPAAIAKKRAASKKPAPVDDDEEPEHFVDADPDDEDL